MAYFMMVLNSCLSQIRAEVGVGLKNMHESQISTRMVGTRVFCTISGKHYV